MDRSTDGGMAPALQSSNHQSTELTNEGELNQAGSALLHKKVSDGIMLIFLYYAELGLIVLA